LLLEALSGLREPDDAFVYYFLEQAIGYDDAPRLIAHGATWAASPARPRLQPTTGRYLDALRALDGLSPPPRLSRPLVDLLADNTDWAALAARPEQRLALVDELLDALAQAGESAAAGPLRAALMKFQNLPGALQEFLRRPGGDHLAAAHRWQSLVAAVRPPDMPALQRYVSTAADMHGVLSRDEADDALILLLAGLIGWDDRRIAGKEADKVRQLRAIHQIAPQAPIAGRAEQQLRDFLQAAGEPAIAGLSRDQLIYLQPLAAPEWPSRALIDARLAALPRRPEPTSPPAPARRTETIERAETTGPAEVTSWTDAPAGFSAWPSAREPKSAGDRTYRLIVLGIIALLALVALVIVLAVTR